MEPVDLSEKFRDTEFNRYRKIGSNVWELVGIARLPSMGEMTAYFEKMWLGRGYDVLVSPQAYDKNLVYVKKTNLPPQTLFLKRYGRRKEAIEERYPGYVFESPAYLNINELTGTKLKKIFKLDNVKRTYHNKHKDGSGNFGYLFILNRPGTDYRNVWDFRGDYDKNGNIYHLDLWSGAMNVPETDVRMTFPKDWTWPQIYKLTYSRIHPGDDPGEPPVGLGPMAPDEPLVAFDAPRVPQRLKPLMGKNVVVLNREGDVVDHGRLDDVGRQKHGGPLLALLRTNERSEWAERVIEKGFPVDLYSFELDIFSIDEPLVAFEARKKEVPTFPATFSSYYSRRMGSSLDIYFGVNDEDERKIYRILREHRAKGGGMVPAIASIPNRKTGGVHLISGDVWKPEGRGLGLRFEPRYVHRKDLPTNIEQIRDYNENQPKLRAKMLRLIDPGRNNVAGLVRLYPDLEHFDDLEPILRPPGAPLVAFEARREWESAKKKIEKFWDNAERTERYNFFRSSPYVSDEKAEELSRMDFKDIPQGELERIPDVIFCPKCNQPLIADDDEIDWVMEDYDYNSGSWSGKGGQKCPACSQDIITSWWGHGGRNRDEGHPEEDLWCDDRWTKEQEVKYSAPKKGLVVGMIGLGLVVGAYLVLKKKKSL